MDILLIFYKNGIFLSYVTGSCLTLRTTCPLDILCSMQKKKLFSFFRLKVQNNTKQTKKPTTFGFKAISAEIRFCFKIDLASKL